MNLCSVSIQIVLLKLLLSSIVSCLGEYLLSSVEDVIGAENYTYFKIKRGGVLRLVLETLEGDADLYVSEQTQRPTYSNYDLSSITCGRDEVNILSSWKRPIGVAVYGNFFPPLSSYRLSVIFVSEKDAHEVDYMDDFVNSDVPSHTSNDYAQSEDGFDIPGIFIEILKILFQILDVIF